jgi:hypothetical protein
VEQPEQLHRFLGRSSLNSVEHHPLRHHHRNGNAGLRTTALIFTGVIIVYRAHRFPSSSATVRRRPRRTSSVAIERVKIARHTRLLPVTRALHLSGMRNTSVVLIQ